MKMEQKKAACVHKEKKLEATKVALEQKYHMEPEQLDTEIKIKNAQQFILQRALSDMSRDTDKTANIDSIKLTEEIGRMEEQQEDNNILFEEESEIIGNEHWRQLMRVWIPFLTEASNSVKTGNPLTACIDQSPATSKYKLSQLRQYLRGDALKLIEGFGHSGYAYQAAKKRLKRKYGGQRDKTLFHIDELENLRTIQNETRK